MTDDQDASQGPLGDSGPVPLAWYDSGTYDEIRAMMSDGKAFASTYEKWEGYAVKVEEFFGAKGVATVRVPVDPQQFADWCSARHREADAKGRLAFSEWVARSKANQKPST
jgi:hypothetical protein